MFKRARFPKNIFLETGFRTLVLIPPSTHVIALQTFRRARFPKRMFPNLFFGKPVSELWLSFLHSRANLCFFLLSLLNLFFFFSSFSSRLWNKIKAESSSLCLSDKFPNRTLIFIQLLGLWTIQSRCNTFLNEADVQHKAKSFNCIKIVCFSSSPF